MLERIENGIRITHEWLGRTQIVEAAYFENRLNLLVDGKEVSLTEEESGYFLAWMATWYEQGNNHEHVYRVSAGFVTVRYCETCKRSWVLANDNGWHWLAIPEAE